MRQRSLEVDDAERRFADFLVSPEVPPLLQPGEGAVDARRE